MNLLNHLRLLPLLPLTALLAASACTATPPTQTPAADLPDAGRDGEYRVEFPEPMPAEDRYLTMTVSEDVQKICPFDPHFAFDVAKPRPQDRVALDGLAHCLNQPELKNLEVVLTGRADARGTDDYNIDLAAKRATNVKTILVNSGVASQRISVRTIGEANAMGSKQGQFSHGYDRRVEVEVRGKVFAPEESGVTPTLVPDAQ